MKKINVIDLFAGAGGLSEGFLQTNFFDFLAHVEWEIPMVNTLRKNLVSRHGYSEKNVLKRVIHFDIQKTEELLFGKWSDECKKNYAATNSQCVIKKGLSEVVGKKKIDVIIGGPPCQAYSIAGRAQDPHSMKYDYRNYLFESFVKVVDYFKPKIFVFENVPGILSAKPGEKFVIDRIYDAFSAIGYKIRKPELMKDSIYSASDYGVPQDRNRVIIFGVQSSHEYILEKLYSALSSLKSSSAKRTVRDAIGFMPKFQPLAKSYKKNNKNVSHELIGNIVIPNHTPRYHNKRDMSVFKQWLSKNMNSLPNEDKLKFYYSITGRKSNHNKYRSLEWDKPAPTVVSHLYKDGLMFIHPDIKQLRSITVREAALLQSFPIDFPFLGSDAYCFKMIGNAVPVLFAKKIGEAVADVLKNEKI